MAVDLEVHTDLLRQAADVLDDASSAFAGTPRTDGDCPLTDSSLGDSAVAREVAGSAGRRVSQAIEAAVQLAVLATDSARKIRSAASAFENAETSMPAGPR
jgi:hypothetical protein